MKFFYGLILGILLSYGLAFVFNRPAYRHIDMLESAEVSVINEYLRDHPECELITIDRSFGAMPRAWFYCEE